MFSLILCMKFFIVTTDSSTSHALKGIDFSTLDTDSYILIVYSFMLETDSSTTHLII